MNRIYYIFLVFALFFAISCQKEFSPTCTITSPKVSQEFYENEDIQIAVTADGGNSGIAYVHLYIDNVGYSSASVAPYELTIKAGDITAGAHKLKVVAKNNEGKSCEASVTVTVKEAVIDPESPDFVTFSDGKLPNGWKTDGWQINFISDSNHDNFVPFLYTYADNATVTTKKTCSYIDFYLKGYGKIIFYKDDVIEETISIGIWDSSGSMPQNWKKYSYGFPEGLHTFTWKFLARYDSSHIYAGLDSISFYSGQNR